MIPDTPVPALRRPALLLASLAAVLLAGAAPSDAPPAPSRGSGSWTIETDRGPERCGTGDCADDGRRVSPFLLARTDAQVVVSGPIAHTILRQEWTNPNQVPVEAAYIFPLPDNAAITGLRLTIGTRRIEAEMRRREEARALYEQARGEGRVAALLDQERPNVFAQRVANIVPGERIDVTIEFDSELRCDDGECAYILPTVVGPRFVPFRQGDPGRIDPPVAPPGLEMGHRLTFTLDIDAGMPIRDLRTPGRRMEVDTARSGRAHVRLASEEMARLDRDVEVRFRLAGREPEFGVVAWRAARSAGGRGQGGGDEAGSWREDPGPGVFTLYLVPPVPDEAEAQATPRELTFILDCSGSMKGVPIESAKDVVRRALRAARPGDTLQILRFSDRASGLWPDPVPASFANIQRALAFLDSLEGNGGTEMLSGIRAALDRPADPERLRLVALLTDGFIGNETEVLAEVRRVLGTARLFAFGIGSSVNRYLLESLAEEGRGAAEFLAPREDPESLVERFVKRIASPVLTDLRLSWEGIDVGDLEPALPPDLFAGQPLVIHGRYRQPGAGTLVLEGVQRGGRRLVLRRTVTLPAYAEDHEALARLWARARIARLTRESYGRPDPEGIAVITDLGLRFRLMTPYTSLVAVDSMISNRGGGLQAIDVPVELPFGMDPQAFAGRSKEAARQLAAPPATRVIAAAPPHGEAALSPRWTVAPPSSQADAGGRRGSNDTPAARPQESAAKPQDASMEPDGVPFVLVRLVEEDGTMRTVESDGEAWLVAERRRTLVRRLTADQMRALQRALAEADAEGWMHGDATFVRGRSRLVVVLTDGTTHGVEIPSGDPTIETIVALLRAATFDTPGRPR